MIKILHFIIFIVILAPFTWTIYVPEHTRNTLDLNSGEYLNKKSSLTENNPLQIEQKQSDNTNLVKLNDVQQSLTTASQKKINVNQLLPIQLHHTSYDIDGDVVNAKNHTNNQHGTNYKNLGAQPTSLAEHKQLKQQHQLNNDVLLDIINDSNDSYSTLQHTRQRRQLSGFLIAPNTHWCGRGNSANGTYNHLGGASMADKCCRTHDHCKYFIPAMSNRFELFNYRPYTLSHCHCDRRFRTCLKMANDEDANTIGKLFFNLVQTQCFILAKETVCLKRASDGTCSKQHFKQKAYLRKNKKY